MLPIPPPKVPMPVERQTTLFLNGAELLRIQTTPVALDDWTTGFLFTEGIIHGVADLLTLQADSERCQIYASVDPERLADRSLSAKRYLTSGCGKGVTFSSVKDAMLIRPVRHDLQLSTEAVAGWMAAMQEQTPLYARSGGMHAAAVVAADSGAMLVREDIGRHNAVDKAIGAALRARWPSDSLALLTTGRISYEMCSKMARAGIGVGASLTAATDQACRLAARVGIDLLGYVRNPRKLVLYTGGHRIGQATLSR